MPDNDPTPEELAARFAKRFPETVRRLTTKGQLLRPRNINDAIESPGADHQLQQALQKIRTDVTTPPPADGQLAEFRRMMEMNHEAERNTANSQVLKMLCVFFGIVILVAVVLTFR